MNSDNIAVIDNNWKVLCNAFLYILTFACICLICLNIYLFGLILLYFYNK
jgi:hypothetical protein